MQKTLRAVAKRLGIETRKAAWYGYRGAPDLLLLGPGRRHGFIEVKREGAQCSALQIREHERLRAAGFWVGVCDGDDDIDYVLSNYLLDRTHESGAVDPEAVPSPRR